MTNGNKKELETTIAKFQTMLKNLNNKYPDVIENLAQCAENPEAEIPEHIQPSIKELDKLVRDACVEIRRENLDEEEFIALFPENIQAEIQKLAEPRLRVFHAFTPLRNLYRESPSRAEYLVDQIWQYYVIRFDPDRRIERPSGITDDDMSKLEGVLDSFAEFCIARTLHYNGMLKKIKELSNMPDGLCEYIARKVDKDYQELRMNYLIEQLYNREEA